MPSAIEREDQVVGPSWADDIEGEEPPSPTIPSPHIALEDGVKVVTEERISDDGKRVKVTRKIKMRLIKAHANHVVVERKKLKKFGESAGQKPGPDPSSTTLGEKVFLKLSPGMQAEKAEKADEALNALLPKAKSVIVCRICKGDHWTTKCPFRESHQPMDELPNFSDDAPTPLPASTDDKSGKYVPPSLRDRKPGERMPGRDGGTGGGRDADYSTLRITNLSEDTTEADVKDLVSKFGNTSRVYVARDRERNQCKGFAFVSFYNKENAERALAMLNGYGYDNLILKVEWAQNNKN